MPIGVVLKAATPEGNNHTTTGKHVIASFDGVLCCHKSDWLCSVIGLSKCPAAVKSAESPDHGAPEQRDPDQLNDSIKYNFPPARFGCGS